jgi:hypothetical protein
MRPLIVWLVEVSGHANVAVHHRPWAPRLFGMLGAVLVATIIAHRRRR